MGQKWRNMICESNVFLVMKRRGLISGTCLSRIVSKWLANSTYFSRLTLPPNSAAHPARDV